MSDEANQTPPDEKGEAVAKPIRKPGHRRTRSSIPTEAILSKDFGNAEEAILQFSNPGKSPSTVPVDIPKPRKGPKKSLTHSCTEFHPGQSFVYSRRPKSLSELPDVPEHTGDGSESHPRESLVYSWRPKALSELPDVPEHTGDAVDPKAVMIPATPRTVDAREDEQEHKSTDNPPIIREDEHSCSKLGEMSERAGE